MTTVRRVMTATSAEGKAYFANVEQIEAVKAGVRLHRVWGWDDAPTLPFAVPGDFPVLSVFPPSNGLRINVAEFPAGFGIDQSLTDATAFDRMSVSSGEGDLIDADPGLHATDTADIGVVISGEVCLELDDGVERVLKSGDVLIQMGTIHAWHNRSDEPCFVALIVLGLERGGDAAAA